MEPPDEMPLLPQAVFHFDDDRPSFEDLSRENGFRNWSARQLMELLGYAEWSSFRKVINKGIAACTTIGAPVEENFRQSSILLDGKEHPDFKLSKFACYLIAMNGDPKKRGIAYAQAYFASIADAFQRYIDGAEDVERVEIRSRVRDHESALCGIAQDRGVEQYAFFQNAGYRGMYNMNLSELKLHKGFGKSGRSLLDFMGKRELAANLFRLTETEAKITNDDLQGQRQLERAAESVGRAVRETMLRAGGPTPEDLPLSTEDRRCGRRWPVSSHD